MARKTDGEKTPSRGRTTKPKGRKPSDAEPLGERDLKEATMETRASPETKVMPKAARPIPQGALDVLLEVERRMREVQPDFSPLGRFLSEFKWTVVADRDKGTVAGKVEDEKNGDTYLDMQCKYVAGSDLDREIDEAVSQESQRSRAPDLFLVRCFIVDALLGAAHEKICGHSIPNLASLAYDLSTSRTVFNAEDPNCNAFSGWFAPGERPMLLENLVRPLSGRDGIFSVRDVALKLGWPLGELEKAVTSWTHAHKVVDVIKWRGMYAFV